MTQQSRLGSSPEQGIKTPCVATTTANITLTGEQTIDSLAVTAGDRVLVKNQTDTTENGIYGVSASTWTRTTDFNAANDVVNGVLVLEANNGRVYAASFTGTYTPGTTALTFDLKLVPATEGAVSGPWGLAEGTGQTIASGAITIPADGGYFSVETQGSSSSDNLDTINGGSFAGEMIIIRAFDSTNSVVCRDGNGNLTLASVTRTLSHIRDRLVLQWNGTDEWVELSWSDNNA